MMGGGGILRRAARGVEKTSEDDEGTERGEEGGPLFLRLKDFVGSVERLGWSYGARLPVERVAVFITPLRPGAWRC